MSYTQCMDTQETAPEPRDARAVPLAELAARPDPSPQLARILGETPRRVPVAAFASSI